jgi:tetratricopeptide (TPR) repeat protein
MSECHLHRDALERFSCGDLLPAEALQVERHLRSGCPVCQGWVDDLLISFEVDLADLSAREGEDAAWDRIFLDIEQRFDRMAVERDAAPPLVAELLVHPPAEREAAVRGRPCFHTLAVCELLIERSFAEESAEPAELALRLVDHLDIAYYGRCVIQDLRARAWAYIGNARRTGGDLAGAEEALARAEDLLDEGSADPLEEARLLDLKASLLCDQGRFEPAVELLDSAVDIYGDIRDLQRRGRALIRQGLCLSCAGRAEEAVARITEGLTALRGTGEPGPEPRLVLTAQHHLAWCLNECGRVDEAAHLLAGLRAREDAPDLLLLWLESRIALRRGRGEEAEHGLTTVRDRFVEKGLYHDASLVMLDLAGLYLSQGRMLELRSLTERMLPAFLAQDVPRPIVVALIAFQEAVEGGRATPGLLQEIAVSLAHGGKSPRRLLSRP